ncbi:hypothetical protein DL89DRAFT_80766 [Linderina pennispora]|uniref:Secreted protein n=1 Tax=Linderina pennispora TaxID=61395 RepID=A0A1Y1WGM3_9FUNG|nr:uncharacterized protein DL89DRAFT_80766 [Linderina pennispora]ORX72659.1 hypothetical protein DL89DRAFT_80766 [Linderina pennispora]
MRCALRLLISLLTCLRCLLRLRGLLRFRGLFRLRSPGSLPGGRMRCRYLGVANPCNRLLRCSRGESGQGAEHGKGKELRGCLHSASTEQDIVPNVEKRSEKRRSVTRLAKYIRKSRGKKQGESLFHSSFLAMQIQQHHVFRFFRCDRPLSLSPPRGGVIYV